VARPKDAFRTDKALGPELLGSRLRTHHSLAEREIRWNAFIADPAWVAARTESEKDGPILANVKSTMLEPTAFSALK